VLYVIDGGGHTWPGSIDVARLGATTHEIYATDEIWDFFQAQGARPR
jgi:polyhydroxybutyrate depolymerase